MRRSRRFLLRLGLVLGTLVACFLVAELVLRLNGYGRLPAQAYDPQIGWRFLPNQTRNMSTPEGEVFGEIRTNSLGYRGPAFPEEKPRDVTRIVCLGDSFTFGWGVEEEECWPWLLQEALEEDAPGRFEVMNFSVPGYNFWNNLQTYRHIARDFSPDLVLLGVFVNDGQPEGGGPRHSNSAFARLIGRTAVAEAFHRHLRSRISWFQPGRTPEEREHLRNYRRNFKTICRRPESEVARPYWEDAMRRFGELVEAVREDGARLGVVFFPVNWQYHGLRDELERAEPDFGTWSAESLRLQRLVARHAEEHQVPFLDLLTAYVGNGGVLYGGIDDAHLSVLGNRVSASAVRSFLARAFPDL